jgi:hypothetical protein
VGDVLVNAGRIVEGKIEKLSVQLHKLSDRVVTREKAIAWMRDGHSLIPTINGKRQSALQLIEIDGEEPSYYIRDDNEKTCEDSLPDLPCA